MQTVGIPLAGFADNTGTEWVARGLPPPPPPKGISPHAVAWGGCLHGRCSWLGHVAQPPAPPARQGRPLLHGGPSSSLAPHPSNQHAGSAWRHAAHTVQTDAWTPTRAHGHVPTGAEVATARALGLRDSRSPPPPTGSKPRARASQHCVRAGSRSIASGLWVLRGPGSQCRGQPPQARWALTSTGRAMHPPTAQPQGDERPAHGRASVASSHRAACRSQPRLEGAEALTCRPA